MPTILNIETSTDVCSVCISRDAAVLAIRETGRSYSHNEVIAVFIDECIREAGLQMKDLDAVAIGQGPGSYTALRIGTATAKGICFALSIPLIAIGTLDALRLSMVDRAQNSDLIIPMIDARRREVYRAIYDVTGRILMPVEPIILEENSFHQYFDYGRLWFCGDGAIKASELLNQPNGVFSAEDCSAKYMIHLAEAKFAQQQFEDISYYEPYYYKGPNITVQKKNILR